MLEPGSALLRAGILVLVFGSACGRVRPPAAAKQMGWDKVAPGAVTDDDTPADTPGKSPAAVCRTVGPGKQGGRACVFPFIYRGKSHNNCITNSIDDDDVRPFCGTRGGGLDVAGTAHVGICGMNCRRHQRYASVSLTRQSCAAKLVKGCEQFWGPGLYEKHHALFCRWYPHDRKRCELTREACKLRLRKGCETFWSGYNWTPGQWWHFCHWHPTNEHCSAVASPKYHKWHSSLTKAPTKPQAGAWPPPGARIQKTCVEPFKNWTWRCKKVGDVCMQGAGLVCKNHPYKDKCLELPCWHPRHEAPPTPTPTFPTTPAMRNKVGPSWKDGKGDTEALLGVRFYCNKRFIPGRAGGFKTHAEKQACCVLDKALDAAWVFHSTLYCSTFQSTSWKQKCFDGQVQELVNDLVKCCEIVGRENEPGDDDCRRATSQALAFMTNTAEPTFNSCTYRDENSNLPMRNKGYMYYGTMASRIFKKQSQPCFAASGTLAATVRGLLMVSRKLYNSDAALTAASKRFLFLCKTTRDNFDCAQEIVAYMRISYRQGKKYWPMGEATQFNRVGN